MELAGSFVASADLYRYIRHPQYLALIVASIGMLLIWPRYLVLVATVTVIFMYIVLAKVEERICLGQFSGYATYMRRTGMLLPALLTADFSLPDGTRIAARVAVWVCVYVAVLASALLVASVLRTYALDSLYRVEFDNDIYVSVVEISDGDLARPIHE